ncbi:transporter [Kitasatospora sp. NPDC004615]|uniref:transporter n=1 Tax=Kitasatospora sp. NPDC004615 TaxID=3364017 RepID=UPI0036A8F40D
MSHHRIDMMVYRRYGDDLVTLELAASVPGGCGALSGRRTELARPVAASRRTVTDVLVQAGGEIRGLYEELDARLLDLGDGHAVPLQHYVAYRRRNFACVRVLAQAQALVVFLRVDPTTVQLIPGWTRDVRRIGYLGTGELEVRIGSVEDLDRSMELLRTSYAAAA